MAIDALYKSYFQKSKVLLYPLLGIKRGAIAIPEQTYLSWDGFYKTEDIKLIAVYPARTDVEYLKFESKVLLNHNRVCDFVKLDENQNIFTFDLSDLKSDWDKFMEGKYSQMNEDLRRKIRDHFDKNTSTYVYVDSYLFPEKYFSLYADLLGADEILLREVGELCSKPDLDRENLFATVVDLENKKILG